MGDTLADRNKTYFKQAAELYKQKFVQDGQKQISEFLAGHEDWIGVQPPREARQTKLMDYACGSGVVSRTLHHLFSKCIGVDLSDAMLDQYRETAAELDLDESRMMAIQGDLCAPEVKPTNPAVRDEELSGFDLVAISLALHHIEDIDLAVKRLAERLRPGGVLLIIDGASTGEAENSGMSAPPGHPAAHTISHSSFTQAQIFRLYEQAGCGESQFVLADRLSDIPGGKMRMFFSRATKL
ncbi:S-adenosyl-L-methionine-dependent methyltransferase [Lipomyces kononenkoae]|uniref:S-adenosyl-L-methionine-dependent methyltransferase n=1 Tax=Lipomyces kononenkoae TaxID=34357 RepID=A0ACC3TAX6_LIPKO